MTERVRCPRERSAKANYCQRGSCNHLTGIGSRICGCCLDELGDAERNKILLMRKHARAEDVERVEAQALERLNIMPKRVVRRTG